MPTECLRVRSSFKASGSGQNMPLGILGRSIVFTRGSSKDFPAGRTSSYDFLPPRSASSERLGSAPLTHVTRDGTESTATGGSVPPSQGWAETTRGALGGSGLSALDPHICANIKSDHLKGAQDVDKQATVVSIRGPCAVSRTTSIQAAERLQVVGQERSRGGD